MPPTANFGGETVVKSAVSIIIFPSFENSISPLIFKPEKSLRQFWKGLFESFSVYILLTAPPAVLGGKTAVFSNVVTFLILEPEKC